MIRNRNTHIKAFQAQGYHTMTGEITSLDAFRNHFLNLFVELMINRFKWINLPDSIDPRYLELSLLNSGSVVFSGIM